MSMTTSSFMNNNTETMIKQESSPGSEDSSLITTNSKIFPSLHPLSSYYRNKAVSPSDSSENTNTQDSMGTIKKIKMNNYTDKIVRNPNQISGYKVPCKVIKEFNNKRMKINTVQKIMNDEPLTLADPMVKALKALQEQKIASMQRKQALLKNMMIQQQISQKIYEYTAMLNSINNQGNLMFDLGGQNMGYNSVPHDFQINEIAHNLIPNMTHLVKICQENQKRVSNMMTRNN